MGYHHFRCTTLLFLTALALGATPSARAEMEVSLIPADQWGMDDADLGLGGSVVEDFEDLDLAPGLTFELGDAAGLFTGVGSATLGAVFDPVNGDPYGEAFVVGVWDGTHVLVNAPGNEPFYYGSTDFRKVRFTLAVGAAWIGFSLQQVSGDHELIVNGQVLGRFGDLGIAPAFGRNGYVVVRSTDPGDPIVSLSFGGRGDAFVVDHLTYGPEGQVPAAGASWGGFKADYR